MKFRAKCLFPRLVRWLNDNDKSIGDVAEVLFCEISNAYNKLSGERKLPKEDIDRLLEWTGLAYEELFGEEGG